MAFLSHRIKSSERGGQRHDGESLKISILFLMAEGNLQISRRCGLVVANFCSDAINGSKWPYLVSQAINSIDSEIYVCMYAWCHMDSTWPASQGHGPSENGKWKFAQMLIQCWPGDSKSLSVVDNWKNIVMPLSNAIKSSFRCNSIPVDGGGGLELHIRSRTNRTEQNKTRG